jgi:(2Fe-2S) ferredoxin
MKPSPVSPPSAQIFVCVNRRPAGDPLGEGCADRGEAVYAALKREVTTTRNAARVWVTRTHCLGVCPKVGATVARYPVSALYTEVDSSDAPTLLHTALEARSR